MTQAPGPHLSPDDVENWLSGTLDAERTRHLDLCAGLFRSRAASSGRSSSSFPRLPPMVPFGRIRRSGHGLGHHPRSLRLALLPDHTAAVFATRNSLAIAASLALAVARLHGREHRVDAWPTRMSSPRPAAGS